MSGWDAPPQLPPLEDTGDVWASTAPAASTSAGSDPQAVLQAVAHPLPPSMLADLDPFAPPPTSSSSTATGSNYQPTYTTLGHTVARGSLLELLPPDSDGEPSPTTSTFTHLPTAFQLDGEAAAGAQSQAPTPPEHDTPRPPAKPATGAGIGSPPAAAASAPPSPSNFFTGVFRSMSSSSSSTPTPSSPAPSTPSKPTISTQTALQRSASSDGGAAARLREELNEKAGPASSGAGDGPAPSTSHLPKPLATIASVFRSPLTSRTSSPAGTPMGTSPSQSRGAGGEPSRIGASGASGREKESGSSRMEKGGASGGSREGKERQKQEEEAQFDFNRFLEQMRSRSADPIAKYLRSFLKEFSRRPPISTADQIRVINDFLDFIATKMRSVDPWRAYWREYGDERAEEEFEMSMEAMEKLVMNRVWHLTFTPALDLSTLPNETSPTGDVERDAILAQRIKLFAWIKPSHLDLPIPDPEDDEEDSAAPSRAGTPKLPEDLLGGGEDEGEAEKEGEKGEGEGEKKETPEEARAKQRQVQGFLDFARRELGKMNQYKAPRDKLICVLNCCKVIFGLIRHLSTKEEGADTFIPFLIYVVLKSNPEHLVSNLQYIQRFRNPDKLSGEGGYYLSSLNGAISFIETVDASSLSNITQEEFETNVANAIRNLPQPDDSPRLARPPQFPSPSSSPNPSRSPNRSPNPNSRSPDLGRGGDTTPRPRPPPLSTNTHSPSAPPADLPLTSPEGTDVDSPSLLQQPGLSFPSTARGLLLRSTDSVERIVSKPLGAIGRIFEQLDQAVSDTGMAGPGLSPRGGVQQALPPVPGGGGGGGQQGQQQLAKRRSGSLEGIYAGEGTTAEEVSREIDRQTEERRMASIGTLKNVFPNLEDEVLEMVLLSNSGDMAKTIDALLEMS